MLFALLQRGRSCKDQCSCSLKSSWNRFKGLFTSALNTEYCCVFRKEFIDHSLAQIHWNDQVVLGTSPEGVAKIVLSHLCGSLIQGAKGTNPVHWHSLKQPQGCSDLHQLPLAHVGLGLVRSHPLFTCHTPYIRG